MSQGSAMLAVSKTRISGRFKSGSPGLCRDRYECYWEREKMFYNATEK